MSRKVWIILAIVAAVAALAIVVVYNRLVGLDEKVSTSWAQVENVLQRRYDLIPNLVNTVKGYAAHEREIFEEVTRLRSRWNDAATPGAKLAAAGKLETAIGRLLLVAENYPDLKASQNFLALQDELAGTENRIAVERRRYNEAVRAYNTAVRRFPTNIFAALLGFERQKAYFEAAEPSHQAPRVQF